MEAMTHLNYSQKRAVGSALLQTLTLWQVPGSMVQPNLCEPDHAI